MTSDKVNFLHQNRYQYFFHHTQITKNKEKILASLQ